MKARFFVLIAILVLLAGCITANVPVGTPSLSPPQEIRLTVNGADVDVDKDANKVNKTMQVESDVLTLSRSCRLLDDVAYMKLTSISSYNADEVWSDLKILQNKNVKELIIYMSNPGGSAFQGMGITDELRLFKAKGIPITMEGRGLIASAAVPVYLEGTKGRRIASKSTVFMIHPARLWKGGFFASSEDLKDLESQAKMIRILNDAYADSIASNSNLSKDKVLELLRSDNWFTADEALKMGFVDEIR